MQKMKYIQVNYIWKIIDLETLGKDLIEDRNARLTSYGVLCRMDEGMINEDEEEFE